MVEKKNSQTLNPGQLVYTMVRAGLCFVEKTYYSQSRSFVLLEKKTIKNRERAIRCTTKAWPILSQQ